MTSLTALLSKWPLVRQIRERAEGTGLEAMTEARCISFCIQRGRCAWLRKRDASALIKALEKKRTSK
jgi:hypothetical protein